VGLKICTLHCNVISVKTVLFLPAIIGVQARGWGLQPPPQSWAKPLFFGQKLIFWAEASSQKFKKNSVIIKQKTEFILSSEIKCLKSGIFTNNYWVG